MRYGGPASEHNMLTYYAIVYVTNHVVIFFVWCKTAPPTGRPNITGHKLTTLWLRKNAVYVNPHFV